MLALMTLLEWRLVVAYSSWDDIQENRNWDSTTHRTPPVQRDGAGDVESEWVEMVLRSNGNHSQEYICAGKLFCNFLKNRTDHETSACARRYITDYPNYVNNELPFLPTRGGRLRDTLLL